MMGRVTLARKNGDWQNVIARRFHALGYSDYNPDDNGDGWSTTVGDAITGATNIAVASIQANQPKVNNQYPYAPPRSGNVAALGASAMPGSIYSFVIVGLLFVAGFFLFKKLV